VLPSVLETGLLAVEGKFFPILHVVGEVDICAEKNQKSKQIVEMYFLFVVVDIP
jgi:hypothetical protein